MEKRIDNWIMQAKASLFFRICGYHTLPGWKMEKEKLDQQRGINQGLLEVLISMTGLFCWATDKEFG